MTTDQKQEELIKRFGNKFYNELGLRVTSAQQLQGRKKYKMDSNSMVLAKQVVEALWKEWVEDCKHEYPEDLISGDISHCSKCQSLITDIAST
jgi:hypothetical protein